MNQSLRLRRQKVADRMKLRNAQARGKGKAALCVAKQADAEALRSPLDLSRSTISVTYED